MTKNIMKSVNIKNTEVLNLLNEFKDFWYNDKETLKNNLKLNGSGVNRNDFISNEYCERIIRSGTSHPGFPESLMAYNLKEIAPLDRNSSKDISISSEYIKRYTELNNKLQIILATYNNALCTVYPPGGFISWHNNANASAYNLIFTWSETGDGYWKHIDPYTKEQIIIKDKPGWQCKAFFFGGYADDPNSLVYHAASTDCWRMTISYVFDRKHEQLQDDIIEELELND